MKWMKKRPGTIAQKVNFDVFVMMLWPRWIIILQKFVLIPPSYLLSAFPYFPVNVFSIFLFRNAQKPEFGFVDSFRGVKSFEAGTAAHKHPSAEERGALEAIFRKLGSV